MNFQTPEDCESFSVMSKTHQLGRKEERELRRKGEQRLAIDVYLFGGVVYSSMLTSSVIVVRERIWKCEK